MMKSLEIIPLRKGESLSWDAIDQNIVFPKIYREFNNTYRIAGLFESEKNQYFDKEQNKKRSLGMYQFTLKPSVIVDTFFDPTEIPLKLEMLLDLEDESEAEIIKNGFIPFAFCSSSQLLMISTNDNTTIDRIFLYTPWNADPLELIAENIFHFFQHYVLNIEDAFISSDLIKSLYRNWGEDFWRVKE